MGEQVPATPTNQLSPVAPSFTPRDTTELSPLPQRPVEGVDPTLVAVEVCRRSSEGLSTDQRERLRQLLTDFKDGFAWS